MKITRLRVQNFRGISTLDTKVPPHGLIVRGENSSGKTSCLESIRAALSAQGIGPDAIRLGTERCEILVDMDDITVRRVITAKGSKLSVDGPDAKPIKAPQSWLNDVLGTAPLDPIDLFQAKPKDRKAKILSALPVRVTEAQLKGWLAGLPDLDLRWEDLEPLHGLEVVEQARKAFAKLRTEENGKAKELEREAAALEAGAPPAIAGAIPVPEAEQKHRDAAAALADLHARGRRVEEQAAKTQGTRDRAAKLHADAATIDASPWPSPVDRETACDDLARAEAHVRGRETQVRELEAQILRSRALLEKERETLQVAERDLAALDGQRVQREAAAIRANDLRVQALNLEAAIASTLEVAPTDAEVTSAQRAESEAEAARVAAHAAKLRAEHEAKLTETRSRLTAVQNAAGILNGAVDKFAKQIPNELLTAANGIPGLGLDGDDVFLDGVSIGHLSGREQLLFAVEIARRLNVRARILIVDGLERVDPESLPEFVKAATAGGFQLLATRVDSGNVVLEAIEPEDAAT